MKTDSLLETYFQVSIESGVIYVLISILMFLKPNLRRLWATIIYQTQHNQELSTVSYYQTRWGLCGFSGYDCTLLCTMFIIMTISLIGRRIYLHKKVEKKYYAYLIILLLGNFFYGRTGLLVSVLIIATAVFVFCWKEKRLRLLFSVCTLLGLLFGSVYLLKDKNEFVNNVYIWVFTPIINLLSTGEVGTNSYNRLMEMHFIPSIKTILVGDGYFTDPETGLYYKQTDVGYLRPTLFFGGINLLIAYACAFCPMYSIKWISKNTWITRFVIFSFIAAILIFEYKGATYYRISGIFLSTFLACVVDEMRKTNNNE